MKEKVLVLVGIICFCSSICLYGHFVFNGGSIAFCTDCERDLVADDNTAYSEGIEDSTIVSAGHFLEAGEYLHRLLKAVEVSGDKFSSKSFKKSLKAIIKSMNKAYIGYFKLKSLAEITPYRWNVINQLSEFDYYGFQEKHDLIPSIFEDVRGYLVCGNVKGLYHRFYIQCGKLLEALKRVKVEYGPDPKNISMLLKISQMYSKSKLYGQYAAMVFSFIR